MLMEALRKIFYSFLPPSTSTSRLSSSSFLSSLYLPLLQTPTEEPVSSTSSPLSSRTTGAAVTAAAQLAALTSGVSITPTVTPTSSTVVTLYKIIACLALLSLLPSSPPCSTTASMIKEGDLQKMFKLRNENEWQSLWHSEKHVRCRDQLLTHMDWACQKDIYRLEKRFKRISPSVQVERDPLGDIFVGKTVADTVIKPWSGYIRRKREEKSITDECCSAAGCTWEEYAEYCPAHRRIQTRRFATNKKRK